MEDWRLNGQESYLKNAVLYRVEFPAFWESSYATKNEFYQRILRDAKQHAVQFPDTRSYLEGERIQEFWHAHCAFCWEKATTREACTFYCTKDLRHWICSACYEDFKDAFGWMAESADDLFA